MTNFTDSEKLKRLSIGLPRWRVITGDGYTSGQLFQDVAAGNQKKVYLENGSDDTYYAITLIETRASGKQLTQEVANVTEDTQGSEVDTGITTKRSDTNNDSQAIARKGGDNETGVYSGGSAYSQKTGGASGAPTAIQPSTRSLGGIAGVLGPGDNVVVQVTNDSTETNDISVDLDWVEIPESEYP